MMRTFWYTSGWPLGDEQASIGWLACRGIEGTAEDRAAGYLAVVYGGNDFIMAACEDYVAAAEVGFEVGRVPVTRPADLEGCDRVEIAGGRRRVYEGELLALEVSDSLDRGVCRDEHGRIGHLALAHGAEDHLCAVLLVGKGVREGREPRYVNVAGTHRFDYGCVRCGHAYVEVIARHLAQQVAERLAAGDDLGAVGRRLEGHLDRVFGRTEVAGVTVTGVMSATGIVRLPASL